MGSYLTRTAAPLGSATENPSSPSSTLLSGIRVPGRSRLEVERVIRIVGRKANGVGDWIGSRRDDGVVGGKEKSRG